MTKKRLLGLFLTSISVSVLASCGVEYSNSMLDSVGDGQAYTEIDDEDIDEITIFKNDWENFNQARSTKSPIYTKIKEKIGCDIYAHNAATGNWEENEILMQAAGKLPDIFLTNGSDNSQLLNSFIENGDILPISDWVSEEHYPHINAYLKNFDYLRTNLHYSLGKHWYIPSTWHNEKSLYVRKDWIDNLNAKLDTILVAEKIVGSTSEITDAIREQYKYKVPETLLDFYRLCRAFTLYDPDGNGLKDTYGYSSESNKDMDSWIFVAYGAGWNQFIKQEGSEEYTYSDIADGSKFASHFVARLIKEGYMSLDALNDDMDGKQNKVMTNKAGMCLAHNWYTNFASALMENNKWTKEEVVEKLVIVEPPAGQTGLHGCHGEDATWQGFCINANMSNARIRKCLELYDYLLSDEGYELLKYGVRGVHWNANEDGTFKESLLEPDPKTGLAIDLRYVDSAAFLYALVEWTMQYKTECINFSEIVIPRERIAERSSSFSDYPAVTTESFVEYFDGAHDYFLEQLVLFEKDSGEYLDKRDDDVDWKNFGWNELNEIPQMYKKKWDSVVKKYKETYHAQEFIADVNARISAGECVKVDPTKYDFK